MIAHIAPRAMMAAVCPRDTSLSVKVDEAKPRFVNCKVDCQVDACTDSTGSEPCTPLTAVPFGRLVSECPTWASESTSWDNLDGIEASEPTMTPLAQPENGVFQGVDS